MLKRIFLVISVFSTVSCGGRQSATVDQSVRDTAGTAKAQNVGQPDGSWLDVKSGLWQGSGNTAIPAAPVAEDVDVYRSRCQNSRVEPTSAIEREVSDAGWTLVAPTDQQGNVSIVTGAAEADGMCRPWNYQIFVFINSQFAGTVSPKPMFSRMDGAAWGAEVSDGGGTPKELTVRYSRYSEDDALCCPSRESVVRFNVIMENGRPRIVPLDVITRPTQKGQ